MLEEDLDVFMESLHDERGQDQLEIARAGLEILALVLRKNTDYGGSAMKPPILSQSVSPQDALRCRMSDKIQRVCKLAASDPEVVGEGINDSIDDLAGYAILDKVLRNRANSALIKKEEIDVLFNIESDEGLEELSGHPVFGCPCGTDGKCCDS